MNTAVKTAVKTANKSNQFSPLDKTALGIEIEKIGKDSGKLQDRIQTAAMSALHHLKESGDRGYCERLALVLPAGLKGNALKLWFVTFGNLVLNTGENAKTKPFSTDKERKAGSIDMDKASNTKWFDMRKPSDSGDFDWESALAKLMTRAKTAVKKGKLKNPEAFNTYEKALPKELRDAIAKELESSGHKIEADEYEGVGEETESLVSM